MGKDRAKKWFGPIKRWASLQPGEPKKINCYLVPQVARQSMTKTLGLVQGVKQLYSLKIYCASETVLRALCALSHLSLYIKPFQELCFMITNWQWKNTDSQKEDDSPRLREEGVKRINNQEILSRIGSICWTLGNNGQQKTVPAAIFKHRPDSEALPFLPSAPASTHKGSPWSELVNSIWLLSRYAYTEDTKPNFYFLKIITWLKSVFSLFLLKVW